MNMGIAAYNRGSKLIRTLIDRDLAQRKQCSQHNRIFCHTYVDFRNGETVRVWCDEIGPLVNQNCHKQEK
jgi:hypothetical protein